MRPSIRALAWIVPLALSACATGNVAPDPPPAQPVQAASVTAAALARSLGFDAPAEAGASRIVLGPADGDRVLLFPGTRVVTIRGERYETSHPVELRDGEAWLVAADADGIAAIWRDTAPPAVDPPPPKETTAGLPPPPPPFQPSPDPPPLPVLLGRVVIDPGHGGRDPGAIAANGLREKDVNLEVSLELARVLEAEGVEVVLTRHADYFLELEERAAVGNRNAADVFVSIHADAAENTSASGFSVYIRRQASTRSYQLAEAIRASMTGTGAKDRGVRRADYRVLVRSAAPAVLVELGFLSNRSDAADLAASNYRDVLARLVGAGIVDFLRR